MKLPRLLHPLAAGLFLFVALPGAASAQELPSSTASSTPANGARSLQRHPEARDTYTITSVIELVPPFRLEDMNDDFQDARIVSKNDKSTTVEITYYPLFNPAISENPNWRTDYAGMTEYLKSTPAENWDQQMQRDLLAELRAAGIEPDRLTDRQLVEQVSRWAMKRSKSTNAFSIWTFHYPDGKPVVLPELSRAFERERTKEHKTEQEMIDAEVLGRAMYYNKSRGSCTSSSIYLTTIFRALGIPARTVFCIPPFDANDAKQADLFYAAVHHHQVRETVREAIGSLKGFANHLFNEVFVGGRWVRLNYSTLGQPVLDARYFGLLTHIYTAADLSAVPLAATWGKRYFNYPAGQAKLSSVNPYRLVSIKDRFGENAHIDNPKPPPTAELTTATIVALLTIDSPQMPRFITERWKTMTRPPPDFLVSYKEWVKGTYVQMQVFQKRVGNEFLLTSPGLPNLRGHLLDSRYSQGDGAFQAFAAEIYPDDRAKIVAGAPYMIRPINTSDVYKWELSRDLRPVVLAGPRGVEPRASAPRAGTPLDFEVGPPAASTATELTTATIVAVYTPDSTDLPGYLAEFWKKQPQPSPDLLISFREWVEGSLTQMQAFQEKVGNEFVLSSPGQPEVRVRLRKSRLSSGDGRFQAFAAEISAADKAKIVPGAAYAIRPINVSQIYRWALSETLKPITFKSALTDTR